MCQEITTDWLFSSSYGGFCISLDPPKKKKVSAGAPATPEAQRDHLHRVGLARVVLRPATTHHAAEGNLRQVSGKPHTTPDNEEGEDDGWVRTGRRSRTLPRRGRRAGGKICGVNCWWRQQIISPWGTMSHWSPALFPHPTFATSAQKCVCVREGKKKANKRRPDKFRYPLIGLFFFHNS